MEILSNEQVSKLIEVAPTPRQKLAIAILADTGIRVTELVTLKWENIDFQRGEMHVLSLKKRRNQEKRRVLPITRDVQDLLIAVFEKEKKKKAPEDYIFKGQGKTGHWRRESINRLLERCAAKVPEITDKVNPHLFRHTYASKLNAYGASPHDVKNALGHENLSTTSIYTHTKTDELRALIERKQPKRPFFSGLKALFTTKARKKTTLPKIQRNSRLIGRKKEIFEAQNALNKEVSVLITGEVGAGKNAILESLNFDRKVLVIENTKGFKKAVLDAILLLFDGDKEQAKNVMFPEQSRYEIINKLNRDNLQNLCVFLMRLTVKNEYILKINDSDGVTPTVVKAIERLKNHFIIVTTAREIPLNAYTAFSDFHQVEVENLTRPEALKMFHQCAYGIEFRDYEHTKNQIWNASEGNPRIITELAERLGKEGTELETHEVEKICGGYIGKHVKEVDASLLFILLFGGALVVWVYTNSENIMDRRLLSTVLAMAVLFGRYFIRFAKRKSV